LVGGVVRGTVGGGANGEVVGVTPWGAVVVVTAATGRVVVVGE
jgi:hypothetical protein